MTSQPAKSARGRSLLTSRPCGRWLYTVGSLFAPRYTSPVRHWRGSFLAAHRCPACRVYARHLLKRRPGWVKRHVCG